MSEDTADAHMLQKNYCTYIVRNTLIQLLQILLRNIVCFKFKKNLKKEQLDGPFLMDGVHLSQATQPLRGDSLLFTI